MGLITKPTCMHMHMHCHQTHAPCISCINPCILMLFPYAADSPHFRKNEGPMCLSPLICRGQNVKQKKRPET